jgi:hypothetical protein
MFHLLKYPYYNKCNQDGGINFLLNLCICFKYQPLTEHVMGMLCA